MSSYNETTNFKALFSIRALLQPKRPVVDRVYGSLWDLEPEVRMIAAYLRGKHLKTQGSSIVRSLDDIGTYIIMELFHDMVSKECQISNMSDDDRPKDAFADVLSGAKELHPTIDSGISGKMDKNPTTLTDKNIVEFMKHIPGSKESAFYLRSSRKALVTFVVAMSNQGNVTNEYLRSRNRELSLEMDAEIDMDRAQVSSMWVKFGMRISLDNGQWATFFSGLSTEVGGASLRLGIIARQAKYAGMTAAVIISECLHEHPLFPFEALEEKIHELEKARIAVTWCEKNPYGAFERGKESNYKATSYPNLAYCCIQLMLKVSGMGSLRGYGGSYSGGQTVRYKVMIDSWIEAFMLASQSTTSWPGLAEKFDTTLWSRIAV